MKRSAKVVSLDKARVEAAEDALWARITPMLEEMEAYFNAQPLTEFELADQDAVERQLTAIERCTRVKSILLQLLRSPSRGTLCLHEIKLKNLLESESCVVYLAAPELHQTVSESDFCRMSVRQRNRLLAGNKQ